MSVCWGILGMCLEELNHSPTTKNPRFEKHWSPTDRHSHKKEPEIEDGWFVN